MREAVGMTQGGHTGSESLTIYTSLLPNRGITDSSQSASCTACKHSQTVLDSLGRVSTIGWVNDPDGRINNQKWYDINGHLYRTSNPYRGSDDPTYGETTVLYDALDRVTKV